MRDIAAGISHQRDGDVVMAPAIENLEEVLLIAN